MGLYPSKIPRHDGTSVLGCEKAVSFLDRISRDIHKNIKEDLDDTLDVSSLENVNNSIMADILKLKDHIKHLKRKFKEEKEEQKNAASKDDMVKTAGTPNNIVISVTPFIRAVSGILINSVVSAGKPFEDVYEYLKNKYDITPREELEILQVLMDSGQPIYKDRGGMPIPEYVKNKELAEEQEKNLSGVDFVTSYFG